MDFWDLPGPGDFLTCVQDDLRAGKNLLLGHPSSTVPGLAEALHAKLGRESWWVSIHVPHESETPMGLVLNALGIEASTLRSASCVNLCRQQACHEGRVLIVSGMPSVTRGAWREFVVEYERASREVPEGARTQLVLMLNESRLADFAKRDTALSHRLFDGVISELDMLLYASRRLMGREDNTRRRTLLASSVSRIAMWDVTLADRLLETSFDQILEPWEVLSEHAEAFRWEKGDEPLWSTGAMASWNGVNEMHSAHLARNGARSELERRLWGAQAALFLPEIERQRLRLVHEVERHMTGPFETPMGRVASVGDLEIGALSYYAGKSNASTTLKERLYWLAEARNDLAHLRRLSAAQYGMLV